MSYEYPYHDIFALKKFHRENTLHSCVNENGFSADKTFNFFSNLAYNSEDIGRCISLMINVVTLSMLDKYNKQQFMQYSDGILNGEFITAICNNEAFNHGSNLNGMTSYIKHNEDTTFDVLLDKRVITNVGAADLLFVSVPVSGESKTNLWCCCLKARKSGKAVYQKSSMV